AEIALLALAHLAVAAARRGSGSAPAALTAFAFRAAFSSTARSADPGRAARAAIGALPAGALHRGPRRLPLRATHRRDEQPQGQHGPRHAPQYVHDFVPAPTAIVRRVNAAIQDSE